MSDVAIRPGAKFVRLTSEEERACAGLRVELFARLRRRLEAAGGFPTMPKRAADLWLASPERSEWLASPERARLIESCTALAMKLAGPHRHGPLGDDAVGIAQVALVKAADCFDPSQGVQFSTYAGRTILMNLVRDGRELIEPIHIPKYVREHLFRLARFGPAAPPPVRRGGKNWSRLAEEALAVAKVFSLQAGGRQDSRRVTSGESAPADLPDSRRSAWEVAEQAEVAGLRAARLLEAVGRLPARLAEAVRLYHFSAPEAGGRGPTMRDLGDSRGVSHQMVQRDLKAAYARLRSDPALLAACEEGGAA